MTSVVVRTYAVSDLSTPLATLAHRGLRVQWAAKQRGAGHVDVPSDTADADIPGGAIVAVTLDGAGDPQLAFVIDRDPLVAEGRKSTPVIRLAGAGLRRILDYGQVWPPDCPRPGDEIIFGWQHPDFDDTGWAAAQSHGTVGDDPFPTPRPGGYPAKAAAFITDDTSDGTPRTVRYRRTYTFAEDTRIGFPVSADDELPEVYVDGVRIDELQFSGKYQWRTFRYVVLDVCAGDVTIAGKSVNLDSSVANTASENPQWFLLAGVEPAGDGIAGAANETVTVDTGASTTGTWIGHVNGTPTPAIDWDATEAAVRTAWEAAADDTVTVTKTATSPHSWTIVMDGPKHANSPVLTSAEDVDLDGTLTFNTQTEGGDGTLVVDDNGDQVVTDTSWSVHTGDDDPGMTPGKIVRLALEQIQARGTTDLDHVTLGFTDTHDSAGNAWGTVVLRVPMQDFTLGMLVERLEAMGSNFDLTVQSGQLVLDGWVKEGRGTDLSATVVLGRDDIRIEQLDRRYDTIRNVIRSVLPDEFHDTPDAPSIAEFGRREATSADGIFESADEADQYADEDLDNLAQPQLESVFAVKPSADRPLVGSYGKADIITCPSRESDATPMRLVGVTLQLVNGGNDELIVRAVD